MRARAGMTTFLLLHAPFQRKDKGMAGKNRKDHRGRVLPPNVSQKADKRYIWRKMIDGRKYVLTDNDLNELKKKIIQKESELQNGIYSKNLRLTLNEWFDKWINLYKGNVKITTRELYMRTWDSYVRDSQIGNMQIDRIKRVHIVELYKELSEKRNLATATIHSVHIIVYGSLEDLVQDNMIQSNPAAKAFSKIERKEPKKREPLTVRQQEIFVNYLANTERYRVYLPMFSCFLGTGMRTGELTGLTWKDIDLVNGIISVNHTMHYTEINRKKSFFVTTPKTESGTREIPIVMDLRRQLLRQREYDLATGIHGTAQIDGYTDFVFHTTKGTPYSTAGINLLITRIVNRYNKQETDRAEKEHRSPELLPNFSPHILRHTFCTRFCENESNIKVIQEIMGHHDIKTTMDIYSHVTKEKSQEIMNELGTKIKIC
jgi:integrase